MSPVVVHAAPIDTIGVVPASCSTECTAQAVTASAPTMLQSLVSVSSSSSTKPATNGVVSSELVPDNNADEQSASLASSSTELIDTLAVVPVFCSTECPNGDAVESTLAPSPAVALTSPTVTVDVNPVLVVAATSYRTLDGEHNKDDASMALTTTTERRHGLLQRPTPWPSFLVGQLTVTENRPRPWPSFTSSCRGGSQKQSRLPPRATYLSLVQGKPRPSKKPTCVATLNLDAQECLLATPGVKRMSTSCTATDSLQVHFLVFSSNSKWWPYCWFSGCTYEAYNCWGAQCYELGVVMSVLQEFIGTSNCYLYFGHVQNLRLHSFGHHGVSYFWLTWDPCSISNCSIIFCCCKRSDWRTMTSARYSPNYEVMLLFSPELIGKYRGCTAGLILQWLLHGNVPKLLVTEFSVGDTLTALFNPEHVLMTMVELWSSLFFLNLHAQCITLRVRVFSSIFCRELLFRWSISRVHPDYSLKYNLLADTWRSRSLCVRSLCLLSLFIGHITWCDFEQLHWQIAWSRHLQCSEITSAELKENLLPDTDEEIIQTNFMIVCYWAADVVACFVFSPRFRSTEASILVDSMKHNKSTRSCRTLILALLEVTTKIIVDSELLYYYQASTFRSVVVLELQQSMTKLFSEGTCQACKVKSYRKFFDPVIVNLGHLSSPIIQHALYSASHCDGVDFYSSFPMCTDMWMEQSKESGKLIQWLANNQHWKIQWDPGRCMFALCSSGKRWTPLHCYEQLQWSSLQIACATQIRLVAWTVDGLEFFTCPGQAPFQGGRNVFRANFSDHGCFPVCYEMVALLVLVTRFRPDNHGTCMREPIQAASEENHGCTRSQVMSGMTSSTRYSQASFQEGRKVIIVTAVLVQDFVDLEYHLGFDRECADNCYALDFSLDVISIHHNYYFYLAEVYSNFYYHSDLNKVQELRMQWDPGGCRWSRLGVKPSFKKGGMLGAYCTWAYIFRPAHGPGLSVRHHESRLATSRSTGGSEWVSKLDHGETAAAPSFPPRL